MPNGFQGRILRLNLTTGARAVESPDELLYRTYFGGRGMVAHYLLNEVPAGADPLGPDNKLIFATGVLTGAPFAGSGRHSVGARSPLTGGFGDAEAGGFWGAELKRAGYDAVIVEGKARRPVYLWIRDGEAEVRDASHLWGLPTAEAREAIRAELGEPLARVALIGPAGENLVRYACITHDLKHFAGRCGLGAVMGSKLLKAVAVQGSGRLEVADRGRLKELAGWMAAEHQRLARGMYDQGTAGTLLSLNAAGGLPTLNFREGSFHGAERISGQAMRDSILVGRDSCFACPIRCKRVVRLEEPYRVDPCYGGPEYETLAALGSNLGIDDLGAIARANQLCGAYGLDTISTGMAIAFAIEAYQNGLLGGDELKGLEGLEPRFGDPSIPLTLIPLIARREGVGGLLAEGVKRAAERLGEGAQDLALHVKGQEIPMHEPRLKAGLGLGYAVSPTGADHCHNLHDTPYARPGRALEEIKALGFLEPVPAQDLGPQKVRLFLYFSTWRHFLNCALLCLFVPWTHPQVEELVRATTGWNTTTWELMKVGERALTLARCFNLREGFGADDDRLPSRFSEPFASGPLEGVALDPVALHEAKKAYYRMMGWDEEGRPTPEKIQELGISKA